MQSNTVEVYAAGTPACKYAKDDSGNAAILKVQNVGKASATSGGGSGGTP